MGSGHCQIACTQQAYAHRRSSSKKETICETGGLNKPTKFGGNMGNKPSHYISIVGKMTSAVSDTVALTIR